MLTQGKKQTITLLDMLKKSACAPLPKFHYRVAIQKVENYRFNHKVDAVTNV